MSHSQGKLELYSRLSECFLAVSEAGLSLTAGNRGFLFLLGSLARMRSLRLRRLTVTSMPVDLNVIARVPAETVDPESPLSGQNEGCGIETKAT
jgi:hypothetical protein